MPILKKLKTVGHVRSGNFWLGDCLETNFYRGKMDVSRDQCDPDANGIYRKFRLAHYGLFGGHPATPRARRDGQIYIYRDGRDVLVSMYRSPMFHLVGVPARRPGEQLGPIARPATFGRYIRDWINWEAAPRARIDKPYQTPVEHWYKSVSAWLAAKPVLCIRYEDLYYRFDETMEAIAAHHDLPRPERWKRPEKPSGRWHWQSRPGEWRTHFTEEDLEYFYSIVPKDFEGLYRGE